MSAAVGDRGGAAAAHRRACHAARGRRRRASTQARAARDLAQIDLDNTVVHAPVAGVVGNRQVRIGRLVAPGAAAARYRAGRRLWVVANFKETQIEHIRPGQRVAHHDRRLSRRASSKAWSTALRPAAARPSACCPPDNATGNFVRVVQRVPVKIRFVGNAPPRPARARPVGARRDRLARSTPVKTAAGSPPRCRSARQPVPEAMRKAMIAEALVSRPPPVTGGCGRPPCPG